jgi:hypothetical protein
MSILSTSFGAVMDIACRGFSPIRFCDVIISCRGTLEIV